MFYLFAHQDNYIEYHQIDYIIMAPANKAFPPPKRHAYKKKIEAIVDHKTDNKCGVRFLVKWVDYGITTPERSPFILEFEEGERILRAYLQHLQQHRSNRFSFMVSRQPDLAKLLDFGEMVRKVLGTQDSSTADAA